jgi:hypothetical protein
LAVGLAVSAVLFVRAMPHSPLRGPGQQAKPAAVVTTISSAQGATASVSLPTSRIETVYVRKLITQPIETIRVGQRVLGTNPNRDEVEPFEEPDPKTWRTIEVEQIKPSGKRLYATLLRPLEWLEEELDPETNTIDLDLAELGAEGPAKVLRIGPCPPIAAGAGHIVTATFKHEPDGELLTLTIGDDDIGCTANHPFWSEDRQAFVEAGQLHVGERVRTRLDEVASVVSIKPRPPTAWVYNLEVQGEHVYEVASNGILVHNWCFRISKLSEDWAEKGFHVHVGKVEVIIRPDHQGGYVFRKAFALTPDKEFNAAVRALKRDLQDAKARRLIHAKAERALEYLRSLGKGVDDTARMARQKAAEIKFLIHAMRKSGI